MQGEEQNWFGVLILGLFCGCCSAVLVGGAGNQEVGSTFVADRSSDELPHLFIAYSMTHEAAGKRKLASEGLLCDFLSCCVG